MKRTFIFVFSGIFLWPGCVGLTPRVAPVSFENPFTRLEIVTVQPSAKEQAGLTLRFLPWAGGRLNSTEETTVYAGVQNDRGSLIKLIQNNTETYRSGSRRDTYIVRTEASFQGWPGSILEELEMSQRGEIVKFMQGKHDSKDGRFTIANWTRTPMFPEHAVKVGESWGYEETMSLRLDSFWVKQTDKSPYKMKATSTLAGFSEVKGRRCAVIETSADQIQTLRFKVLFKSITLYVRAKIRETTYLDYKTGAVMAKIAKIQSYTNSADSKINDYSISQTISYQRS